MGTCVYENKNGEKCRGYALKNDSLCYFHSPQTKKERVIAAQKGGKVCQGDFRKDIQIESANDIIRLLETIINGVKSGKIDAKVANAVFYGANISLKAIELFKIQARLDEISKYIERQGNDFYTVTDEDCLDPFPLGEPGNE